MPPAATLAGERLRPLLVAVADVQLPGVPRCCGETADGVKRVQALGDLGGELCDLRVAVRCRIPISAPALVRSWFCIVEQAAVPGDRTASFDATRHPYVEYDGRAWRCSPCLIATATVLKLPPIGSSHA